MPGFFLLAGPCAVHGLTRLHSGASYSPPSVSTATFAPR